MQGARIVKPLRTRVYVDGYNLYYGCLKGTPYKWLDLLSLFERRILPSVYLTDAQGCPGSFCLAAPPAIKFFTAKILQNVARSSDSVSSQARYYTALRKTYPDRVEVIEGYYALNQMKVRVVNPAALHRAPRDCEEVQAWKVEEKQSDVNLALHAFHDAMVGNVDQAVIVTNDTDIAPALKMIRGLTSVRIGLVVPTSRHQRVPNTELASFAHWVRTHITQAELSDCQLPRVILGRRPTVKPESWYARPNLLEKVLMAAIPICGDRGKAFKWLETVNQHFGNKRPLDLLDTEAGMLEVVGYIRRWLNARGPA